MGPIAPHLGVKAGAAESPTSPYGVPGRPTCPRPLWMLAGAEEPFGLAGELLRS